MVTKISVNIGSGKGILPEDTKPLPEPMLSIIHAFCGILLDVISLRVPKLLFCIMNMKIILVEWFSLLPGANELTIFNPPLPPPKKKKKKKKNGPKLSFIISAHQRIIIFFTSLYALSVLFFFQHGNEDCEKSKIKVNFWFMLTLYIYCEFCFLSEFPAENCIPCCVI